MAAALSGCIVPVPLDQQAAVADSPPHIVSSQSKPTQGQDIVHSPTEAFEFSIVATDVDLEDVLSARLLRRTPDKKRVYVEDIPMSANDASNNTARSGTSGLRQYCRQLSITGSDYVSIRVTDRKFANSEDDQVVDGALFDDIYWVLSCQ